MQKGQVVVHLLRNGKSIPRDTTGPSLLTQQHAAESEQSVQKGNRDKIQFRLGRQEDSHEFLRYLVEGMQDSETGKLPKGQNE